jgi:hypothetical protein
MMRSDWKSPSIPPSQDVAHTMIGDFTEITVSSSDDVIRLVKDTSARLMAGCRTFWKWRFGALCYCGCSFFLLSSLYFFTSLDLSPVEMASARIFIISRAMSSGAGVSQCSGSTEWLPYGTEWLWDIWVHTFVYIEQLFDCFLYYSTLLRVYAAQRVHTETVG